MNRTAFVLLPAYNEEESLPALLPKLKATLEETGLNYKIVVCDDGSTDKTTELAKKYGETMPLILLEHKINRGLGETVRDLFEWAAEHAVDGDVIMRMDCDDTHEPKYIPAMIEKLDNGYDVVIASRFEEGGGQHGVNGYRSFISRCANLFMKVCFPLKGVREYSCGYRVYRASTIKNAIDFYGNDFVQLKGLGFTGTLEKLVKLKILGAKFAEVGFQLRYDQKVSESKMVSSITTFGYFTMAVLYHWPWGGWRSDYSQRAKNRQAKTL